MLNLMSATFTRFRKHPLFIVLALVFLACSIMYPVQNYSENIKNITSYVYVLEDNIFSIAFLSPIFSAVFCSLYFGTEYSNGTIRNKIIWGFSKRDIYLSSLFSSCLVMTIFLTIYFLVYIAVGTPLLGFFKMDIKTILQLALATYFSTYAFIAYFIFIAMNVSSKSASAVICILCTFVILIVGVIHYELLCEPEYVDEVNEYYNITITGTKRNIYRFYCDFFPPGQIAQTVDYQHTQGRCVENLALFPLFSAINFVITTVMGMFIFKIKPIK